MNQIPSISIRKANSGDAHLYYEWANDPDVRKNSFNSQAIDWKTHISWFNKALASDDIILLVFSNQDNEFGQMRISLKNNMATMNYSIAKEHRGKGLSQPMIAKTVDLLKDQYTQVRRIEALVKPENKPSSSAFQKCGFKLLSANEQRLLFELVV